MNVSSNARPRPTARFTTRDLEAEMVFFDQKGERFHVLNGTARAIYLLCDGSRSVEEVARRIAGDYSVDPPRALADAQELIARLAHLGILTLD